jgi:hypothetical protein
MSTGCLCKIEKTGKKSQKYCYNCFVHGWKHNAGITDDNVKEFKDALKNLNSSGVLEKRRAVGVYIGWRGKSLHGLGLENLTYWDRKAVAQEVGKGGVSDTFIELEGIYNSQKGNYLFIIGHSFGGAVTLSALNEILLERVKIATETNGILRNFGNGVLLINPAIEANQILHLKEASMLLGGLNKNQPKLLHILSSKGDFPNRKLFPLGQNLGVALTWSQYDMERKYFDRNYVLSEYELDVKTVGNYSKFRTSALLDLENISEEEVDRLKEEDDIDLRSSVKLANKWIVFNYCDFDPVDKFGNYKYLPCHENEPVSFVLAPKTFIGNHNDIFNKNTMAYFSTIVSESTFKVDPSRYFQQCVSDGEFSFESCFNYHYAQYDSCMKSINSP